jgi:hypothetical protein
MNQWLPNKNIDDLDHIRDFFYMKNHQQKWEDVRYMDIDKKEYQHRKNRPLRTVREWRKLTDKQRDRG